MDDNSVNSPENSRTRSWLPVIGLTFSAFIFNTSEFIPIGLLSDIAKDFGTTESHAGLLITIYAWVVALASLPLMLIFAKTENRKLMLSIFALFIASHIVSGISTSYNMLMLSRIGVACSHAIFWSIVTPLGVKVAPEGKKAAALSMIVAGSSFAMIIGLPIGRTIGLIAGWRATFLIIAAVALAVMGFLAIFLTRTPSDSSFSLRKLPALIKTPPLLGIYLLTMIMITGHYTGYSYIEPFLANTVGMGEGGITAVLTIFGIVGIFGSIVFSKQYDRHSGTFIRFAVCGTALFLLLLHAASSNIWTTVAVCILWGLAINSYNLTFQSEIISCAPQGTAVAMSIYSGIYNIGIGSGALIGGIICDGPGVSYIGYSGGVFASIAAAYCLFKLIPVLGNRRS